MLDDEKPKVSLSEPDVPLEDEELVNIRAAFECSARHIFITSKQQIYRSI